MHVVVPHRVAADAAGARRPDDPRVVGGALGEHEHGPAGGLARRVHGGGQLLDERRRRRVDDGVDGVEPQTVDVEVLDPPAGALDERAADEVAPGPATLTASPHGVRYVVGEVRSEAAVRAALRAEVVVDDVEHDAEPGGMGGVDEAGKPVRSAVGLLHGRREHAVVAPVADAWEGVDRHQLDRRHAEADEPVELAGDAVERALRRERADVQLVEHGVGERRRRASRGRSSGTSPGRRRPTDRARRRVASPTPGRRAAHRRRAGCGSGRRARPRRRRRPTSRDPSPSANDAGPPARPPPTPREAPTPRSGSTRRRPGGRRASPSRPIRVLRRAAQRSGRMQHSDGFHRSSIWATAARGQETQAGRTASS